MHKQLELLLALACQHFLTLFTGYDYMRKGIDHAMSEDNKRLGSLFGFRTKA